MYGIVNINGVDYIERAVVIPVDTIVTVGFSITRNLRVVMPGIAPFLLKALSRQVISVAAPGLQLFKFKFGNTDGGVQYTTAGIGGLNDRVVDTLIFGAGPFPFPLVPHIYYSPSASFTFEIEDLSNVVPYTVSMALIGSFLLPA